MSSSLRRSSSDLSSIDRVRARKLRLRMLEREQTLEDNQALVMTEDQRQALVLSFKSVKTEFSDLDGLSWKRRREASGHITLKPATSIRPFRPPRSEFAVLTNADLASFSGDDTIRVPPSRIVPAAGWHPYRTSDCGSVKVPTLRHDPPGLSVESARSGEKTTGTLTDALARAARRGTRSPVKGLFQNEDACRSLEAGSLTSTDNSKVQQSAPAVTGGDVRPLLGLHLGKMCSSVEGRGIAA